MATVGGTTAVEEVDERLTVTEPEGTAAVKKTVPVEAVPPTTAVGLKETDRTFAATTFRLAEAELPPSFAVIVAETFADTAVVVI
jgi:hypothetical protein